jgi:cysteine desulfurase/selenocysteine lyase
VLTEMEHHSNLVPWQVVAQQTGARLRFIGIDDQGRLDLHDLDRLLDGAKVLAFTAVSNTLGTINPVAQLCARAHAAGALAVVDACQAVPRMPVDVGAWDCDFMAFSAHKMLGPTGIGVLWGRSELLSGMPPFNTGGGMINVVELERSTYAGVPARFEAGTPPIAEAIGLGAAVEYLQSVGMERIGAYEAELTQYALDFLGDEPHVRVYGPQRDRGGVISMTVGDIHAHDLATILDSEGVCVRAGHHCNQPLMRRLGVPATTRASMYLYNTPSEVDALLGGIRKAKAIFKLS